MKKSILLTGALLLFLTAGLAAQTHNAVPLSDAALYQFLEQAEMKGYTGRLRAVRPYPRSLVVSVLEDMKRYESKMSSLEKGVYQEFYDKYVVDEDLPILQDGDFRVEGDVFTLKAGADADIHAQAKLNDVKASGGEVIANVHLQGDVGPAVSWGLDLGGGVYVADEYDTETSNGPTAWAPNSYTKLWDGGIHPIDSLNNYAAMPDGIAFGYSYDTEIAASFWDNAVDIRFGRLRRDWGIGEGNLFLSGTARPFTGFEGAINPWDWFNFSFLTGTLEYGESFRNVDDYNIKRTSRTQQNMFSILQLEIMPTDWLYFSLTDSAVYMKRPEMGYLNPLYSQFFYQNNVGDFDNMAMGGTIALKKAGWGKAYFTAFLDEARFNHPDFFGNYANMYSYQTGVEAVIPGLPWTTALLQYTKVEPFTYTHYTVNSAPWYYGLDMETDYLNNGENLGYNLEPNSDELMLKFRSQPKRGVTAEFGYKMIRHGTNPGSYFSAWGSGWLTDADGNYIDENGTIIDEEDLETDGVALTPDNDPNGAYGQEGRKDFLKDAVYEWFHVFTLGGSWDLSSRGTPIAFGANYDFVFKYFSDYQSSGNFKPINSGAYKNQFDHLVSLTMTIYP
ncbi:MAG: hypothetical protein PQJ58_20830 [Spirochaetales bacterium]|nr:hypothetical protein [Spirochaetales bacterium]